MALAGMAAGKTFFFYVGLVAVAVMLARQIEEIDLDDPADCLARFRANRMVGLLVFAALIAGSNPF